MNRDKSFPGVEMDCYVTGNRLAKLLDCSPRTINKWRLLGKGPTPTRLPTGAIRYMLTDVENWLRGDQGGSLE